MVRKTRKVKRSNKPSKRKSPRYNRSRNSKRSKLRSYRRRIYRGGVDIASDNYNKLLKELEYLKQQQQNIQITDRIQAIQKEIQDLQNQNFKIYRQEMYKDADKAREEREARERARIESEAIAEKKYKEKYDISEETPF
jgi:hypothetical protein